MKVGGDKIERLRAGELLRHLVYRSAISSTETGLDHERGTIADNEAEVWHKRDAVVWDDMDVGETCLSLRP